MKWNEKRWEKNLFCLKSVAQFRFIHSKDPVLRIEREMKSSLRTSNIQSRCCWFKRHSICYISVHFEWCKKSILTTTCRLIHAFLSWSLFCDMGKYCESVIYQTALSQIMERGDESDMNSKRSSHLLSLIIVQRTSLWTSIRLGCKIFDCYHSN